MGSLKLAKASFPKTKGEVDYDLQERKRERRIIVDWIKRRTHSADSSEDLGKRELRERRELLIELLREEIEKAITKELKAQEEDVIRILSELGGVARETVRHPVSDSERLSQVLDSAFEIAASSQAMIISIFQR